MSHACLEVVATRSGVTAVVSLGSLGFADAPRSASECGEVVARLLAHMAATPDAVPARAWTFRIRDAHGVVHDERAVTAEAARHPSLHDALVELVHATEAGERRLRPWADEETPTGAAAILAVALSDPARTPDYLRYLRSCDLDHEVYQAEELDALVAAHGWTPATIPLAAARIAGCAGQIGDAQFREWQESGGLAEYLASPAGHAAFVAALRVEVSVRDGANVFQRLPERAFDDRLGFLLDDLAEVLSDAELAELGAFARAQRSA